MLYFLYKRKYTINLALLEFTTFHNLFPKKPVTGPVFIVIACHQLETRLKMNFTMIIFWRIPKTFRDHLQITCLILCEFKLFP